MSCFSVFFFLETSRRYTTLFRYFFLYKQYMQDTFTLLPRLIVPLFLKSTSSPTHVFLFQSSKVANNARKWVAHRVRDATTFAPRKDFGLAGQVMDKYRNGQRKRGTEGRKRFRDEPEDATHTVYKHSGVPFLVRSWIRKVPDSSI